ncbi:hypothetical protein HY418_01500 [Candidatus Kaiserbacteria bacterium]|nr:hypothetical protein [Candidatus Kaiserbacteria bacterium]
MSWATRRKAMYLLGVFLFFALVIGGPLAYGYFSAPATCSDGTRNQGETSIDRGGPCLALDEQNLQPHAVLWSRAFKVRDGSYNAVAYIENPNPNAGAPIARYRFSFYDAGNILIAEREGTSFIMPGGITPVFEPRIDTGNRLVAHTYFEFTGPLSWQRMYDTASAISISDKEVTDITTLPRVNARAANSSVADILSPSFVIVVFDPSGNAFAASQTSVQRLSANGSAAITFTWPDPFAQSIGRMDIIPLSAPVPAPAQ